MAKRVVQSSRPQKNCDSKDPFGPKYIWKTLGKYTTCHYLANTSNDYLVNLITVKMPNFFSIPPFGLRYLVGIKPS
uniref:Putative ovule protein n=1 Tax=Solanum chacoense TaxID=4108 RepID=A0A0V0HRQ2_SOLCH